MNIYDLIGIFSVLFIGIMLVLLAIALTLGYIAIKKGLIFLPGIILWVLTVFYIPAKKISGIFTDDIVIDKICVEVMNKINEKYFKEIEYKDRTIFIPQCLRSVNCPAKINYYGLNCVSCDKCCIAKIKNKADELGYSLCIIPGSRFIPRILNKINPKAVLCVACPIELNEVMAMLSNKNMCVQGVTLLKDGCVETDVNIDELFHVMELSLK